MDTNRAIDLGAKQRAIIVQLRQDQQRLAELDEERAQCLARINASRGQLDLIAELAQDAQTSSPLAPDEG
jgi:cell division protein FtsB